MADKRWEELYLAYAPLIYSKCRKILDDDASAQDATQETFIRAYVHLAKVRDVKEALPWIYSIATRYCLQARRNVRRQARPVGELPEPQGVHAEESFTNRDFLLRLLERVPEKVKVVAWLHYMEGLDQGEVARVLGLSRRTVVYRLAELSEMAAQLRARGDT
ncbi:MAG TPA: sigma-70 family RNA polymerase sigma factor [Archangium sp.]|uniref:RNA polymerase sigma factor n=1 Tax=Archangium sp. TaxID=1872627 RepID=UPI002E35C7AB|nr:sigma-70 family RNA polymerase sigma factor [Archangium sp.]HEX5746788.1 sigma-70 family RNA polymerase sigma factor [Archangium sp.]